MDHNRLPPIPFIPSTTEDALAIVAELERILASAHFCNSKRYPAFLRYVVEAKLAGKEHLIKERTLGVEVFRRPADYDTSADTVVRFTAGEVRKRLLAYYRELNPDSPPLISLPVGSYIPEFFRSEGVAQAPIVAASINEALRQPSAPLPPESSIAVHSSSPTWLARLSNISLRSSWFVVALLSLVILGTILEPRMTRKTALDRFWAPLTNASVRVFVYTGTDNAYLPTLDFTRRFKQTHHLDEDQRNGTLLLLPPLTNTDSLTSIDVYPKNNSLVDAGDLAACFNVVSFLTRRDKTPDLRSGNELSAEDLAASPAVFIGAFSNRWTMQVSRNLPFRFDLRLRDYGTITEDKGQKRVWEAKVEIDGEVSVVEDYSIAARLIHSDLGKPVVIAAGLMAPGSEAASQFITSPESIRDFVRNAPGSCIDQNLEVVLKTTVVKGHPGPPIVVASKCW